jgi:TRAP-type mannitol/chloroaromatic compound transport system permease large subunit
VGKERRGASVIRSVSLQPGCIVRGTVFPKPVKVVMTYPLGAKLKVGGQGLSGVITDVPIYTIFRGVFPFLGAMIICLMLLLAFLQIVLFLPSLMRAV